MPHLSIVISVHDKAHYIADFMDYLRHVEPRAEIVVVDDGSSDGTTEIVRARADIFIRTENVWEVKANNAGLRAATGDYIAIVQDDDFILPERWASTAVEAMQTYGLGILGCRGYGHFLWQFPASQLEARLAALDREILLSGEMRREDNGRNFWKLADRNGATFGKIDLHLRNFTIRPWQPPEGGPFRIVCDPAPVYRTEATIRSPFIIDRRVIATIGVMDEAYAPLNMDDHDFCMRARRAGFAVAFTRVPSINRFRGGSRWLYAGTHDESRRQLMDDSFRRNSQRFYGSWLYSAGEDFALQRFGAIHFQPSLLSQDAVVEETATVVRVFDVKPERPFD